MQQQLILPSVNDSYSTQKHPPAKKTLTFWYNEEEGIKREIEVPYAYDEPPVFSMIESQRLSERHATCVKLVFVWVGDRKYEYDHYVTLW